MGVVLENVIEVLKRYKKEFLNELKIQNYSENTIETYSKEIEYFIEYFRMFQDEIGLEEINRPFIQQSLIFREEQSVKDKISANTKKLYIKALYQFCIYLTDCLEGKKDFTAPFQKINVRSEIKEKKYLNEDEVERLFNYLEVLKNQRKMYPTIRNILLVKIVYFTGMRVSEVLNLTFNDIKEFEGDKDIWQIRVFGKGKKEAFCYIKKDKIGEELEQLQRFRSKFHIDTPYLFCSKKGRKLTRFEAYDVFTTTLRKAGINKQGVHIFRHTLGFNLAQKNVRIEDIQEVLRHANISTTRIYVQRKEIDKINSVKKIW
jgi:integrase/recombinase XerD